MLTRRKKLKFLLFHPIHRRKTRFKETFVRRKLEIFCFWDFSWRHSIVCRSSVKYLIRKVNRNELFNYFWWACKLIVLSTDQQFYIFSQSSLSSVSHSQTDRDHKSRTSIALRCRLRAERSSLRFTCRTKLTAKSFINAPTMVSCSWAATEVSPSSPTLMDASRRNRRIASFGINGKVWIIESHFMYNNENKTADKANKRSTSSVVLLINWSIWIVAIITIIMTFNLVAMTRINLLKS